MKYTILFFGFQLLIIGNYFSQEEGFIINCPVQGPFIVNENDTIYTEPDINAEFPGGRKAMNKYLQEKLKYPETGVCIEGKCYLRFMVDTDGNISNIKVLRGVTDCPECDQEAIKALKSTPNWIPGKVGGKPVRSYFDIPVSFSIN